MKVECDICNEDMSDVDEFEQVEDLNICCNCWLEATDTCKVCDETKLYDNVINGICEDCYAYGEAG